MGFGVIRGGSQREVVLASVSDRRVTRTHVEGLRTSAPQMIQVQVEDLLRQHSERIAIPCIADLFAIAENDLPGTLGEELKAFSSRAAREFKDMPNESARIEFLDELLKLDPKKAPRTLRKAVLGLEGALLEQASEMLVELRGRWDAAEPEVVNVPRPPPRPSSISKNVDVAPPPPNAASGRAARAKSDKPKAPRIPASARPEVDPARAESIRLDVMDRLRTPEYAERGLKEAVLVGGCRHRSIYKDLTEAEVKAELRRLEREGKVKHTGERWIIR